MSSKKSRMGKMLKKVQKELENTGPDKARKPQKAQAALPISPLDVSSIEKASFFEDDEVLSFGNPLHSTALEDDLSPNQGPKAVAAQKTGAEGPGASRAETPKRPSRVDKGHSSGKTRVPLPSTSSNRKGSQLRPQRKSVGVKSGTRALPRVSEGPESDEATGRRKPSSSSGETAPPLSGRETTGDSNSDITSPGTRVPPPKRSRGAPQTAGAKAKAKKAAAPAPPKNKAPVHSEASKSPLEQESSGSTVGQQPSSTSAAPARRRSLSSLSSDDLADEDPSWVREHQIPGRASSQPPMEVKRKSSRGRQDAAAQKRKSSSGSSGDAGPSNENKRRGRDVRNPIDLDVVLDAFLDFVSNYKETVDSALVRQAIDAVSDMFEDQLSEKITNTKELNSLKRENMKVNGAINKKRTRLIEIKSELLTKEAQLRRLQKEHGELQERLTDLRNGTSFLSALRDLHKNYLAHRQRHPTEQETYGPSSVPALMLEARGVLGAECQLKIINENLRQALEWANRH